MYLEIFPSGSKSWRLKYRFVGKEKRVVFGLYPAVSLADARARREAAKKILAAGGDPGEAKQEAKRVKILAINNSFEALALEWHEHKRPGWSQGYADDILEYLRKDVFLQSANVPLLKSKRLRCLRCCEKWSSSECWIS